MTKHIGVVTCVLAGCAMGGAAPKTAAMRNLGPAPAVVAGSTSTTNATPIATEIPEQLVVEGSVEVSVTEIGDVVPALRAVVEQTGGRVINESVTGAEQSWNAVMKLRLPPAKVEDVIGFLAKRGDIVSKHIQA